MGVGSPILRQTHMTMLRQLGGSLCLGRWMCLWGKHVVQAVDHWAFFPTCAKLFVWWEIDR